MRQGSDRLSRSFGWLNATQFFGALNDNIFKLFLIFFLISTRGEAGYAIAVGTAFFVLPFLLFAAAAGALADRLSKRKIVVAAKFAEIAVMLLGCAAFYFRTEAGLLAVMFLMATQSAFFGPSKYGIVPELVGREQLSRANALFQAFTYLAIILGTATAPFLSQVTSRNYVAASLFCVAIAIVGTAASLFIERTPPAGSDRRASLFFIRDIWRVLVEIRPNRHLFLAVLASAYFLLIGAFMQLNLIPYGMQSLGLSQEGGGYLFLLGALGIGVGSLLAGRLSGRNVEIGIVPIGAVGLTVTSLALALIPEKLPHACVTVVLMGVSAGLFIVPIQAWIQFASPRKRLGEILAASSFLSWVGVLVAAGLIFVFGNILKMGAREGFLVIGLFTLLLTALALRVLPDFLFRFICLVVMRLCYRLRVIGTDNVPLEGAALLVCNHVSWLDGLLLMATQQRRIRFLMLRRNCEGRWYSWIMRLMGIIPISHGDRPKQLAAALAAARGALDEGYLVCIFAEGAITQTGNLLAFRTGLEHIVGGTSYPIIPVYLGGAWGSIFSYYHGRPLTHRPIAFPYHVSVLFGKPLPSSSTTGDVRQAVLELSCDYFNDRRGKRRPLGDCFVRTARRHWSRTAVSDSTGARLSFGRLLAGSLIMAKEIEKRCHGKEMVGVLLPPSAAGAVVNIAATLLGKVPVNLNYSASPASVRSAIEQCRIDGVFTSRAFCDRVDEGLRPESPVYVEDLLPKVTRAAKLRALLKARFLPRRLLDRIPGFEADRLATVIFSSGSTGEPKGVMLSHHSILSNIEAMRMVFQPAPSDCVCGVLPFFHSFGFSTTLWFPLLSGFPATYVPDPRDGRAVARAVRRNRATLLFATPTFLAAYFRRATPEDFASLRGVIVGAEKLTKRVADRFEEKYGVRPLEGYGATELSPVISINIPDVEMDGRRYPGKKEGTVGHPLAGVVVKIVDPETREALPPGKPGLILVKGPNVMLGYLGKPGRTAEVLRDGWYDTGDIGRVDRDGFVTITDRLARFSKIGGEMVPHIAVEELLERGLKGPGRAVAVTSIPDERKGEKLAVLYTDEAGPVDGLRRAVADSGLPNLWKPRPDCYFHVDVIPMLGSGKLDIVRIRQMAREKDESDNP